MSPTCMPPKAAMHARYEYGDHLGCEETSGLQEIGLQQASLTLHGTSFEHDGAFDGVPAQLVLSRRRLEELI